MCVIIKYQNCDICCCNEESLFFDVEDGLALALRDRGGAGPVLIDCGSQQGYNKPYVKGLVWTRPETFVLSHFHIDHYNGLFHPNAANCCLISRVYFPIIPRMPANQHISFTACLFAMNAYLLGWMTGSMPGKMTGSMEYDLLRRVQDLNGGRRPSYSALYQGKKVHFGSHRVHVLWPPRFVDGYITKSVRKAIDVFNRAKESDERLREIYERIWEQQGEWTKWILAEGENEGDMTLEEAEARDRQRSVFSPDSEADRGNYEERLPDYIQQANRELRKVANRLSLSFYDATASLLFLGDLMAKEINAVLRDWVKAECSRHVRILVTAHHGTHWGCELKKIGAEIAISSTGPRLVGKVRREYAAISRLHLSTHMAGDIVLRSPLCVCFA